MPSGDVADADWMTSIRDQVSRRIFGEPPERIGRFIVLEQLGKGGMGLVYRAQDSKLARTVAIKRLRHEWVTPAGIARLEREGLAMARVTHPQVVRLYEPIEENGQYYLVMECIEGQTLAAWLAEGPSASAIRVALRDVGEGLAAIHREGIVHRDLNPNNILVDASGRAKVADFGLAHVTATAGGADDELGGEPSGQFSGTPEYMAPEQRIDGRATMLSDQFSYCLMFLEAVDGKRPFQGDDASLAAARHSSRGLSVAARVRRVLLRGIDADPRRRWADMTELLAALDRAMRPVPWRSLVAGSLALPLGLYVASPASEAPCDALRAAVRDRVVAWQERLGGQQARPLRGYFDAMIEDWSREADVVCEAEMRGGTDAVRLSACHEQNARQLDAMIDELGRLASQFESQYARGQPWAIQPARWAARTLLRACRDSSSDARPVTPGLLRAEMLLLLNRPGDSLRLLKELGSQFVGEAPASFHLLTARALSQSDSSHAEILEALHAAEDAAERQRDDLGLVDARMEQAEVLLRYHRLSAQYNQSDRPAFDGREVQRKLDGAENILRRMSGPIGDDHVRLLAARANLADEEGDHARADALGDESVQMAEAHATPQLLTKLLSDRAERLGGARAAEYDARALEMAPDDDELRGHLHEAAARHAFDAGDSARAQMHVASAREHYLRVFDERSLQVTILAYSASQSLYQAGEARQAKRYIDGAVEGYRALQMPLQLGLALYLRSAIAIRLGDGVGAVADARRALSEFAAEEQGPDSVMWRTILETGLVEALVAAGRWDEALELAAKVEATLDGDGSSERNGQRSELRLARARAWRALGRDEEVRRELAMVTDPTFLEESSYKRGEALELASEVARSDAERLRLCQMAGEMYVQVGADGEARRRRLKNYASLLISLPADGD